MSYFAQLAARSELGVAVAPATSTPLPKASDERPVDIVEIDAVIEHPAPAPPAFAGEPAADRPDPYDQVPPVADASPSPPGVVTGDPQPAPEPPASRPDTTPATPELTPSQPEPGPERRAEAKRSTAESVAHAVSVVREWIAAAPAEPPPGAAYALLAPGAPPTSPVARDGAPTMRVGVGAPSGPEASAGAPSDVPVPAQPPRPAPTALPAADATPLAAAAALMTVLIPAPSATLTHASAPAASVPLAHARAVEPIAAPGDHDERLVAEARRAPVEVLEVSIGTISVTIEAPPPPPPAASLPVAVTTPAPERAARANQRLDRHYIR